MSVNLNEDTEINVPLKTLLFILAVVVSASWYVSSTYERITTLESDVRVLTEKFENYKTQPGRSAHKMDLLDKDLVYVNARLDKLEKNK